METEVWKALRMAVSLKYESEWYETLHPEYHGMEEEADARMLEGMAEGATAICKALGLAEDGEIAIRACKLVIARVNRTISGEQAHVYVKLKDARYRLEQERGYTGQSSMQSWNERWADREWVRLQMLVSRMEQDLWYDNDPEFWSEQAYPDAVERLRYLREDARRHLGHA